MSCTSAAPPIDSSVFVYRKDARFRPKQEIANDILRSAIDAGDAWVPHQVVAEFVAAMTRGKPVTQLLSAPGALHEADDILPSFRSSIRRRPT